MIAKYVLPLRILHWLIALIILSMIAVGWYMAGLPRDNPNRELLFFLHKSFGVTLLGLVLLRLTVRLTKPAPPLPEAIPPLQRRAATMAYVAFYLLMIGTPIVGYLLTNAFGLNVPWFGLAQLPKLISEPDKPLGKLLSQVHAYFAYTLLALIGLHVSAVIKHYVWDKINLLPRMW